MSGCSNVDGTRARQFMVLLHIDKAKPSKSRMVKETFIYARRTQETVLHSNEQQAQLHHHRTRHAPTKSTSPDLLPWPLDPRLRPAGSHTPSNRSQCWFPRATGALSGASISAHILPRLTVLSEVACRPSILGGRVLGPGRLTRAEWAKSRWEMHVHVYEPRSAAVGARNARRCRTAWRRAARARGRRFDESAMTRHYVGQ